MSLVEAEREAEALACGVLSTMPELCLMDLLVRADGAMLSIPHAIGRACAEILSGMTCYIGYIMVAFDEPEKRALHDHICSTRVVQK